MKFIENTSDYTTFTSETTNNMMSNTVRRCISASRCIYPKTFSSPKPNTLSSKIYKCENNIDSLLYRNLCSTTVKTRGTKCSTWLSYSHNHTNFASILSNNPGM